MTIAVGDRIPAVTLMKATAEGPEAVSSEDFFRGRKVALFSVPGAFTPTCSARHLPSFIERADELRAKGVDEIACVSVGDAFVLRAWAEQTGAADTIVMLADGNGELAEAMGLTVDLSKFGMGRRGQRWSAVVNDGVIETLNIEEPGAYQVSGAEFMIDQL